jgi:hypothetical protein
VCIRCILCLKCSSCKELRDNCGTNLDQAQRYKVNKILHRYFSFPSRSRFAAVKRILFGSADVVPRPARDSLDCESLVLKQCFPVVGTLGHEWVPERYGQFAMSQIDESRLLATRKVSDVPSVPRRVGVCFHWC